MRRALQLLLASLALVSLMSLTNAGPLNLMSAPNLLRVGTAENIFVECQDCSGVDQLVTISVKNHPTKTRTLATTQVNLKNDKSFQGFGQITIPPGDFSKDPTAKQYVYLEAAFPGQTLEKVVMVSFQSGYIFIQTNMTLYTPNSKENCSMQKNGQIRNDERTPKICESTETSKVEYAYKVLVEEIVHEQSIDMYAMRVQDSIKDGSIDVGPMGKLRQFLSYPHCREALKLEKGKTYLIMGSSRDIYRDEKQQTYQYVLGEITWIEYWPTAEECQRDEHTDTCLGLEKMVEQYTVFGCPN